MSTIGDNGPWWGHRNCCCPETCRCPCVGCEDECAACCFLLNLASVYEYFDYHANCTWRGRTNGDFLYLKTDDGGTTYYWEVTWNGKLYTSAPFEAPLDCLTQSYELSGEGETVTLTPEGNRCLTCGCVCSNCGETLSGYNAPCCVRAEFSGFLNGTCTDCDLANRRVWLKKTGDCTWEGKACGVCSSNWTVTLTIAASSISVQYGSYTFFAPWSPGPGQTCCWGESAPFTIGNPAGGPECNVENAVVKLVGYDEDQCDCNATCATMDFSGVKNFPPEPPNDCQCAACTAFNSRLLKLRPEGGDRCRWIGSSCSFDPGGGYAPCRHHWQTLIWWEENVLYAGVWFGPDPTVGSWIKFSATFPPGWRYSDIDGAILSYDSGNPPSNSVGSCDFTSATVKLGIFEDDCDCGVRDCDDYWPGDEFFCDCADDAYPNEYHLIVPDQYSERDISGTYIIGFPISDEPPFPCQTFADYNKPQSTEANCQSPPRSADRIEIHIGGGNGGTGQPNDRSYISLYMTQLWVGENRSLCDASRLSFMHQKCYIDSNGSEVYDAADCMLLVPGSEVALTCPNPIECAFICFNQVIPNCAPTTWVQSIQVEAH